MAQRNLGVVYLKGQGVLQDDKLALDWYLKAAQQENALAQSDLGAMYYYGQGVPQDDKQALFWYSKAVHS